MERMESDEWKRMKSALWKRDDLSWIEGMEGGEGKVGRRLIEGRKWAKR
jgi:hypothetical protein